MERCWRQGGLESASPCRVPCSVSPSFSDCEDAPSGFPWHSCSCAPAPDSLSFSSSPLRQRRCVPASCASSTTDPPAAPVQRSASPSASQSGCSASTGGGRELQKKTFCTSASRQDEDSASSNPPAATSPPDALHPHESSHTPHYPHHYPEHHRHHHHHHLEHHHHHHPHSNRNRCHHRFRLCPHRRQGVCCSSGVCQGLCVGRKPYSFVLEPKPVQSRSEATFFALVQSEDPQVRCAVDIGGTLAKVAFFEDLDSAATDAPALRSLHARTAAFLTIKVSPRRLLRFTYFRTTQIGRLIECLRSRGLVSAERPLRATGGGALKFSRLLQHHLGAPLQRTDEMKSIMDGLAVLATHTNSVFRFDVQTRQRIPVDVSGHLYPFLVVNIGSGVSILKATSPGSFVRVTGTCIGGGTVLGLARLLFHAKSFKQVVCLSERGEKAAALLREGHAAKEAFINVRLLCLRDGGAGTDILDLKVADLCGDAAGSRCISPNALASRKEDIARSLIHMVSYNLGYLAYLVGTAHGVRRIFFAGKYINNYAFTMESITKGVNFYRMQYDRHAAASLRPSSPLLAAPPAFNVAAQQRLLQLQKQMRETQPTGAAALPPPLQELLRASETDSSGHTSADDEPLLAPSAECAVLNALQSSRPRLAARGPSQVEETRPSERSRQATTEKDSSGTLAAEEPSQAVSLLDASEGEKASGADSPESSTSVKPPREGADASAPHRQTEQSQTAVAPAPATFPPFEVLFLRHDGYLGAVGALAAVDAEDALP